MGGWVVNGPEWGLFGVVGYLGNYYCNTTVHTSEHSHTGSRLLFRILRYILILYGIKASNQST